MNAHVDVFIFKDSDDSGPVDDGDDYRMTSAIPSADSGVVASHFPSDTSISSTPAPLLEYRSKSYVTRFTERRNGKRSEK